MLSSVIGYFRSLKWSYVGEVSGFVKLDDSRLVTTWVLQARSGVFGGECRRVLSFGNMFGRSSEHSRGAEREAKVWAAGGDLPAKLVAAQPKKSAPVLRIVSGKFEGES